MSIRPLLKHPVEFPRSKAEGRRWAANLAGYIDGEGHFRLSQGDKTSLTLHVTNTKLGKLLECRRRHAGSVSLACKGDERSKPRYRWYVHGTRAMRVIEHVLDYLDDKREQAVIAWNFQQLRNQGTLTKRQELELRSLLDAHTRTGPGPPPPPSPSWLIEPDPLELPLPPDRHPLLWENLDAPPYK